MNHIILFDLDGTLTDPKEGITKSVQHALQAYGIDEPDLDKLCPFIGPPLSDSFKEYYGFSEAQAREAIGHFHEYFTKQGMFENKVYPGIREMLTRLKDAGLTLAVATSKPEPFAIQILEHFDLLSYFTLVGGADMEEIRVRKGDVIAYTLDRLGTTPEESKVIMVGDRKHDVLGARENGLPCAGVLYGYGSREELEEAGFASYYVDHTAGIWPQAAGGIPFNACEFQSKGDAITDLFEDMAAEQKARTTYDNILRLVKDPEVCDPIRFLRQREIVHFQRFGEGLRMIQDDLDRSNFYMCNPEFDPGCGK